jgi:hypothetical protein
LRAKVGGLVEEEEIVFGLVGEMGLDGGGGAELNVVVLFAACYFSKGFTYHDMTP